MNRTLWCAAGGVLIAGLCTAQELSFEAASVKVFEPASRSPMGTTGGPGTSDPGRIHFGRVAMIQLLTRAYGVAPDEVVGPGWIRDTSREATTYDITAIMSPMTTKEQFQSMLRDLLIERFHLAVHRDARKFPGYSLVIAKGGPRLKEAQSDPGVASATDAQPLQSKDGVPMAPARLNCVISVSSGAERIRCQGYSIAEFAATLGHTVSMATGADPAAASPRVIDKTRLAGNYDFTLEFSCEGCRGLRELAPGLAARPHSDAAASGSENARDAGLPSIFVALDKQMGLRLEKGQDISGDVVVVDHVDKIPTQN
jgi:uncharacterized protein (TIGR03435 family)